MEVFIEIRQGRQALVFSDRLNEGDIPRFAEEIQTWADRLLGLKVKELLIEFGQVTFVSSGALRVLLTTAKRARKRGATLVIANLSDEMKEVLLTSGFLEEFESFGRTIDSRSELPSIPANLSSSPELYLLPGEKAVQCNDGDCLGLEGNLFPEIIKDIPGIAPRHITFQLIQNVWTVHAAEQPNLRTRLDRVSVIPGQSLEIRQSCLLRLAALRIPLRLVFPPDPLDGSQVRRWFASAVGDFSKKISPGRLFPKNQEHFLKKISDSLMLAPDHGIPSEQEPPSPGKLASEWFRKAWRSRLRLVRRNLKFL